MTAQTILQVALKLFSEKGYEATTLADIASEIGIKKPSIYAHYPSKMNLFLVIVEKVKNDYRDCWLKALKKSSSLPPNERLQFVFFSVGKYLIHNKDKLSFLVRLSLFPPADCGSDALSSLNELNIELVKEVAAIFQQGMDDGIFYRGSPEEMAHAYFCLLDGYLSRIIRHPNMDYKKALSVVWNSLLLNPQKNSNA